MVSVILIWIYMTVTCYITGYLCLTGICRKGNYQIRKESSYLFSGIVLMTVYAEIFSLFGGVSFLANALLLVICLICFLVKKEELAGHFRHIRLTVTPQRVILILVLFLLFAYGTASGLEHYDTGLYHAQSIRWIEEYGIVPGLGNLHSRLAYNSAAFSLSALYSMVFLTGRSFHCCTGYFAFLLAVCCTDACCREREKKLLLSDLIRVMAVYYLLNIFDEMISPASDYFMVLTVFWLVIRWLELLERKEKSTVPYSLLCILGVYVCTIKFSGALIVLLTIWPAVKLIQGKRVQEIIRYIACGLIVLVPFLIRNVILSGWLLYPFTAIDLFDLPFKIPKGVAEYDSREIQVYGRGYSDVERFGESIVKWFPDWVRNLDMINQVFLLAALAGLLILGMLVLWNIFRRKKEAYGVLFLTCILGCCFLFWLLSAPLIRYGCVFLWVYPTLLYGYLYQEISPRCDRYKLAVIALGLLGIYKGAMFGRELIRDADHAGQYLLVQQDYETFETTPYDLHGYTFYYPKEGDRTGYIDFPAAPVKAEDIFIGDTIEDGFHDVIHTK